MKLSLIVPCFNEEASLPLLLARAEPVIQNAFGGNAELIASARAINALCKVHDLQPHIGKQTAAKEQEEKEHVVCQPNKCSRTVSQTQTPPVTKPNTSMIGKGHHPKNDAANINAGKATSAVISKRRSCCDSII